MSKYVYLFELDSVRKTDREIITAQKVLYDEIVQNGNIVVMTYNQVVDSRGFFSLLSDETYYDSIISLFDMGAIRVSQYGSIRTIAQYVMNTIEDDKKGFIYSALPLKACQKRLLALVYRCLLYTDLSEIYEFAFTDNRSLEEVDDLFIEVNDTTASTVSQNTVEDKIMCNDGCIDKAEKVELIASQLDLEEKKQILQNLYGLLSMVLRLSSMHKIYIAPRPVDEYQHLRLPNILDKVLQLEYPKEKKAEKKTNSGNLYDIESLFNSAKEILVGLENRGSTDRSVILREIKDKAESYNNAGAQENDKTLYNFMLAEAIINLCYNYACEISICNISKHYNISDIDGSGGNEDMNSFRRDFFDRLARDWSGDMHEDSSDELSCDLHDRYLQEETNDLVEFSGFEKIPDFKEAVRIEEYIQKISGNSGENSCETVKRYEYELETQKKTQRKGIMKHILQKMRTLFVCILFGFIVGMFNQVIQSVSGGDFDFAKSLPSALKYGLETIAFLIIGEIISELISKKLPRFVSLSEAFYGIIELMKDAKQILRNDSKVYFTNFNEKLDFEEMRSYGDNIDYYETKEIRKYKKIIKSTDKLVSLMDEYVIEDVGKRQTIKKIMRLEELYSYKFGVTHNSKYNMLIVDPIVGGSEGIYPYERIVSAQISNGVVVIPRYYGKFILLRQARHALRRKQLCFPRGYGESKLSPKNNALKEIYEEIGGIAKGEPQFLGKVSPDSGLTSTLADIYMVELDEYKKENMACEGIMEIIELTEEELEDKIRNGDIDDGFTVSAFAFYKFKKD